MAHGDVVKKLDDGIDERVIQGLLNQEEWAIKVVRKRYLDYARRYALNVLAGEKLGVPDSGRVKGAGRSKRYGWRDAGEIADEALTRLIYGSGPRSAPAIRRFKPGRSSLATYIGNIVKHVAYERGRRAKRERSASETKTAKGTTANLEDVIEDTEALDPEEALEQRESERELRAVAKEQGQAIEMAFQQLEPDEQAVIQRRMAEPPATYKEIAQDMFPDVEQKKAVQRVMVRLYRARKHLEELSGMPLRGLVGVLGDRLGPDKRGRPRKNPDDGIIYFEMLEDLADLLEAGVIDEEVYAACVDELERSEARENPAAYDLLPLEMVEAFVPLAEERGVSEVARSQRGFLAAYRRERGRLTDPEWIAQRHAFIARHMAQVEARGEALFGEDGYPTRRHLALIMWGYSPEPDALWDLVDED